MSMGDTSLQVSSECWLNQQEQSAIGWASLGTWTFCSFMFLLDFPRAVRALCDHTAAGPDQLSFQRGEVLRVISTVDEDWLRCGRDGVEGLVPVGYTSLVL